MLSEKAILGKVPPRTQGHGNMTTTGDPGQGIIGGNRVQVLSERDAQRGRTKLSFPQFCGCYSCFRHPHTLCHFKCLNLCVLESRKESSQESAFLLAPTGAADRYRIFCLKLVAFKARKSTSHISLSPQPSRPTHLALEPVTPQSQVSASSSWPLSKLLAAQGSSEVTLGFFLTLTHP